MTENHKYKLMIYPSSSAKPAPNTVITNITTFKVVVDVITIFDQPDMEV